MTRQRFSPAVVLIVAGSGLFIFVLWLSAYLEPDIRWLHFFQAWMYLSAIVLSLRHNRWGYFIGLSAAAFWDYINLFVTTFFRSGLHWTFAWISTGQLQRLDQIVAVPGWIGNFFVIVGSIWGYLQLPDKRRSDLGRLALALVLTIAFSPLQSLSASHAICRYFVHCCIRIGPGKREQSINNQQKETKGTKICKSLLPSLPLRSSVETFRLTGFSPGPTVLLLAGSFRLRENGG